MKKRDDLQFNSLVPVDHVAGQTKSFDVDDVDVAAFRADVQPFALERQVEAGDPVSYRFGKERKKIESNHEIRERCQITRKSGRKIIIGGSVLW